MRTAARGSVLAIDTGTGVTTWLFSTDGVPISKGPEFSCRDPVLSPDGKLIATSDGKDSVTLSSMGADSSARVAGSVAAFTADGARLVTDAGVFDVADPMRPRSVSTPLVWPSVAASGSADGEGNGDAGARRRRCWPPPTGE